MASLKIIRKRITSVRNTQKITRAMKMVAAAKLRRAQTALVAARPYATQLAEVVAGIVAASPDLTHPLLVPNASKQGLECVIFTSDRGLCGGFNSNLLRQLDLFFFQNRRQFPVIDLTVLGRKGRDYFRARKRDARKILTGVSETFNFSQASVLASELIARYGAGECCEVTLAYNRFKSAISSEVMIEPLLPVRVSQTTKRHGFGFIFEPGGAEVLHHTLPVLVATKIYQAALESWASELGSRMSAMDSATNNAADMIGYLTLKLNRARQATITTELMDIVNGAESLKA